MAARTGGEFLQGLRENPPELYLQGERVKDPTTHGGLRNGVHTLARLYDLQHEPELRDIMTYDSPSTGEPVGLSFVVPRTQLDLQRRSAMMTQWARVSCGMMGRTPDFLNVSFMAMAEANGYFARNRPEFGKNVRTYYEFVRENDLVLTHTLINLQRSRQPSKSGLDDTTDVALSVVKETGHGLVVHGARVLATLPVADEIAVYPPRSHHLPADAARRTSFAFALPCHTPGLKFLCRESFDLQRTRFDHPLGSRFEEMDAIAFFDNVLVPWERVFLLGDLDLCNNMSMETGQYVHSGHQVVTKNVVKCEFILGLANLMVQTLGSCQLPQVQQMLAEIIENLEVTKACLRTAEVDAKVDEWGVMSPAATPLMVARQLFIRMYPRMAEILHLLGSSSLMALPTEADLSGPLAPEIRRYLETDTASAEERVRLFRLAWDTCCSASASRQVLYERFFQGDQVRNAFLLNTLYDKQPMTDRVRAMLEE